MVFPSWQSTPLDAGRRCRLKLAVAHPLADVVYGDALGASATCHPCLPAFAHCNIVALFYTLDVPLLFLVPEGRPCSKRQGSGILQQQEDRTQRRGSCGSPSAAAPPCGWRSQQDAVQARGQSPQVVILETWAGGR